MSIQQTAESEVALIANAVRELARRTGFPVAFGGLLEDGAVNVSSIVGNRTRSLEGLRVQPLRGLGGRAMIELRPRMTHDYRSSPFITHDYDGYVLGEGLRTLLAIPVIVAGRSRGVLYAGAWEESPVGGVTTAPAVQVAESLAGELRIREEVERRLRGDLSGSGRSGLTAAERESLRESFGELRQIAAAVADPSLRDRINAVERRLIDLAGLGTSPPTSPVPVVRLSPRETDVLAGAALGSTNAEIAASLGLREATVKAYLGTAMAKLDASTRHAAVARARRAGLLP
ncbi:LuxR C-terminal-related transcriptional regulator [Microbacterium resistens]